jgi:hypothetical protein
VREYKNDCGDQSAKPYERKCEPKRILSHSVPPLAPTDAMLGPQADGDLTKDHAGLLLRVGIRGRFAAVIRARPRPSARFRQGWQLDDGLSVGPVSPSVRSTSAWCHNLAR